MAITKWIPFGATPNTTTAPSTSPAQQQEPIPIVTAADAKQFGLENFGNTCYANSVLQALYFCGPFRDLVVQYPDPSFPEELLAAPQLPVSPPLPTSPPPIHARPKPTRKASVSEPPVPNGASPTRSPGLPIPPAPPTLLSALRSLYLHISRNPADKGTVAPRAFIEKLKELNELFRSTMHQDAHEFLNYLLNQIVEEMDEDRRRLQNGNGSPNGAPGEDLSASVGTLSSTAAPSVAHVAKNTLVHQLFEGILTSETRCLTCETVSSRDESFLDLSIDIEQNSSVTACLRQFSASEMLCQRNKFFCDACCDLQEAEKRMKIKKLPNILALHLKRFKYQEDVGKYIKLAYRVAFPLELRLFNTVDDAQNPDRLYELFAIVVHIGNGPHHGHYVSVVKARGTWFLFDDDSVETIKESDIPKYFGDSNAGAAYVLYYQAVDLDLSALGLRSSEPEAADISTPAPEDSSASQTATLATTQEADESTSPSPALPPGLSPDDQQTPSPQPDPSPPTFTSPFTTAAPQPIPMPQPSLSLDIPVAPSSVETSTSSPTVASPSGGGKGFFGSLRHSPSIGLRSMRGPSSSSNSSEQRKSTVDVPPVPPIPIPSTSRSSVTESQLAGSSSSLAASAPSPLMSPVVSNGKEKEKSSNKWFKRKSLRSDKPPPVSSSYAAERSMSAGGHGSEDSSAPWYNPSKRINRRASEAGLASLPSSPVSSSVPSSVTATPMRAMSPALRSVPEGRNPTAEPFPPETSERRNSRQRPSTAGGAIERPRSELAPPLPPMPSPHAATSAHAPQPGGVPNGVPIHVSSSKPQRPHTAHAHAPPSSIGISASNGTTSTLSESASTTASSNAGAARPPKRATRKLSLTAPMLGFGRKEKEKRPSTSASVSMNR